LPISGPIDAIRAPGGPAHPPENTQLVYVRPYYRLSRFLQNRLASSYIMD
jgi:hypothetical protein